MRVNLEDRFINFASADEYLTDKAKNALFSAAEARFGNMWDMCLGDFFSCLKGDFSHIGVDAKHLEDVEVAQAYWMKDFAAFLDEFLKMLGKLQMPQTAEQKQASAACLEVTFEESVLIFMREYFGLHSFDAVLALKVSDYIIAKKDAFNNAAFSRAMAKIEQNKYKKK